MDTIELIEEYNSKKAIEVFDSELMQVFLNILKNAQDNFREKVHIKKPSINIKTSDTQKGVLVEITDNGGGIPDYILVKIFDPYFSTKDEKEGTGLGLYMSKTIVEEHHSGKFYAKNIENGVCFFIELNDIIANKKIDKILNEADNNVE